MRSELYLDTARLGRMCSDARKAEQDFCWLVSQLGSSLYLEQFLSIGYDALPQRFKRRLKGLRCWQGVDGFSDLVRRSVNASPESSVLFFGQSRSLIEFAARGLLDKCSRILATDLCWPPYLETLKRMAKPEGKVVSVVRLSELMDGGISVEQINDIMERHYNCHQCDGLFVSDISYLGYRLPVGRIISKLNPVFAVVDGAQAIGQRPIELSSLNCDLYLAGTQKWLEAYYPLRLGIVARASSAEHIRRRARMYSMTTADGLFRFAEQLRTNRFPPYGDTVSIAPLITAAAAFNSYQHRQSPSSRWRALRENAQNIRGWVESKYWSAVELEHSVTSGIVRLKRSKAKSAEPHQVREELAQHSVVASAYEDGSIRMSMPPWPLSIQQLTTIRRAIEHV